MTRDVYSVNVSLPAHNEQDGITAAITSILKQHGSNFKMSSINVYLDGCTDSTEKIVRNLSRHNHLIKLFVFPDRQGKISRLNQIYRSNNCDVLITFDADIVLGSSTAISQMVKIFQSDPQANLVAAHQIPIRPDSFIGKAIYGGYRIWDDTRLSLPGYDHIQNHYGAASAFRKSFISQVQFPEDITDDRGYLYLMSKKTNGFRYTKSAYIYYRPVSTLHDFFKLADRSFSKNEDVLAAHFGPVVYNYYHIPLKYKLKAILVNLIKDPLFTSGGLLLNILTRVFHRPDKLYDRGMWEMSASTKQAIREIPYV
jgi:cellulose synthase/poly-beta-1,6-N-acetylglucosamine synthase-like glycosyltransferase